MCARAACTTCVLLRVFPALIFCAMLADSAFAVELYTDMSLSEAGLIGSYVDESLQGVTDAGDWRTTQSVSGTRVDVTLGLGTADWGTRAEVGVTGGSDADWDYFSVQWDGYVRVTEESTRLATCSDDGSRFWVDLNTDGVFSLDELVDNGWGNAQGLRCGERSATVPQGVYPIRLQYYEIWGGNDFHLIFPSWSPQTHQASSGNPAQTVKVIVINYEPRIPSEGNLRLWEVFQWNDPRNLVRDFIRDLEYSTGGGVRFEVVAWRHLDAFPVFSDGFRYDPDEYVQYRRANSGWHEGGADFYRMAEEQGLTELVNAHEVDELWCFGDHYFGLYGEAWMAGPNAFFINGPSFPDIGFDRAVAGYGFNYERGVAEMLHNLCHRTENHGQRAFGSWNLANPQSAFDHYSANYNDSPGRTAGVGTCHIPANADDHYDYGDPRTVASTAFDWQNFPEVSEATTLVDCQTWGFGPLPDHHRDYLNFYYGMMPRNSGVDGDGRQANWFKYIWDFNTYEANTGLPREEDAFASADKVRWAGGAFHPLTVRYYDTQAVDASSLGDGDVVVSGPNGFSAPAMLVSIGPDHATTSGSARTARYLVYAPGGYWDGSDSGAYTASLADGQVLDTQGNPFPAGPIGAFQVEVDDPRNLDIIRMLDEGSAQADHTPLDIGGIGNLFDGSASTLVRTPAINPAQVTLAFDTPQTFGASGLYVSHTWGDPAYQWSLETADNIDDMNSQAGSWQQLVDQMGTACDILTTVEFAAPVSAGIVRLTAWRLTGDDYVHLNEWVLIGNEDVADTDGDGLPDAWEELHFEGLEHDGTGDTDHDGLPDADEYHRGTDPNNPDSDGDGLSDGTEAVFGTNPALSGATPRLEDVYVAFDFTGVPEVGSPSAPFNTIAEALIACASAGTVHLDGSGSTAESPWTGVMEGPLTLRATGGPVRIGLPVSPPPIAQYLAPAPVIYPARLPLNARETAGAYRGPAPGERPSTRAADGEVERLQVGSPTNSRPATTVCENVMPTLRDHDGALLVGPGVPIALRLTSARPLAPESLWGNLLGVDPSSVAIEWQPALDDDLRNIWVIFRPQDAWPTPGTALAAAGGTSDDGHSVLSATYRIRLSNREDVLYAIPPLANGVPDCPRTIVPNEVFAQPYRVWLPVPVGLTPDQLEVFYFHDGGPGRGWYRGDHIADWLVPNSYQVLEEEGATYLGFLVRHGGVVQLGPLEE